MTAPAVAPHPAPSRPLADPRVGSVAIVRLRVGLGDLLASVPALRSLRAARPDVHVALITWEEMRPVVARMARYVDELIPFPGYPGIPERPVDLAHVSRFFGSVRERRFDVAVQMYGSLPAANEVTERIGARVTAGFFQPRAWRGDARTHLPYPHGEHEIHRHLELMEFLGVPGGSAAMEFPVDDGDRDEAARVLCVAGVRKPYVVVHPGATASSRRWPPERFAAVADRLAGLGAHVVVTGVAGEEALVRHVVERMRVPAADLCGVTSLGGFAALLDGAALLVGNESGPAQLAAALGVPSVTMFFAGDPARWAPFDAARHAVLAADVGCRPCGLLECPIDFRCAHELSVDRVARVARSLLRQTAPSRSSARSPAGGSPRRRSGRTPPGRARSGER